ncbi:hypothetical protein N656DRAFT_844932 [Canariomyces notabilis]|uniref:RING-type domain-containing protein n=1 Tax=Canariomyces notabilis TaxID=2074819 RepID=A0AAN6TE96_9PEZI|nr:hypothetical protein N656DRAFT_844932 [Canariomyces arenarius]
MHNRRRPAMHNRRRQPRRNAISYQDYEAEKLEQLALEMAIKASLDDMELDPRPGDPQPEPEPEPEPEPAEAEAQADANEPTHATNTNTNHATNHDNNNDKAYEPPQGPSPLQALKIMQNWLKTGPCKEPFPKPAPVKCFACHSELQIPGVPLREQEHREACHVLECGHVVGAECIKLWVERAEMDASGDGDGEGRAQAKCPFCRRGITLG